MPNAPKKKTPQKKIAAKRDAYGRFTPKSKSEVKAVVERSALEQENDALRQEIEGREQVRHHWADERNKLLAEISKLKAVAEPITPPSISDQAREEAFNATVVEPAPAVPGSQVSSEPEAPGPQTASEPVKAGTEPITGPVGQESEQKEQPGPIQITVRQPNAKPTLISQYWPWIVLNIVAVLIAWYFIKRGAEKRQLSDNNKALSKGQINRQQYDSLISVIEAQRRDDSATKSDIKAILENADKALLEATEEGNKIRWSSIIKIQQANKKNEEFIERLNHRHNALDTYREAMRSRDSAVKDTAR